MNAKRFQFIADKYQKLRVAVVGDFCLDRYLEIDPDKTETSLETGLPVHNVVRVRAQPGGAGTILNNLVALGAGTIYPVGFAGNDAEGFELRHALLGHATVKLDHFLTTPHRHTFTYCKPLIVQSGKAPVELNRLDIKNWSPTPEVVQDRLADSLNELIPRMDVLIILDQAPVPETGVISKKLLAVLNGFAAVRPELMILADSRRGLKDYSKIALKMNRAEVAALTDRKGDLDLSQIANLAAELAHRQTKPVFVTLAEGGILGASTNGETAHLPALPLRGPIDIVGAGDAVMANLAMALAAGATLRDALEIANAAASVVIHQLGTTGVATVKHIRELLETRGAI